MISASSADAPKRRITGSSNGRTSGFGPEYWGSSPCPVAMEPIENKNQSNLLFGYFLPTDADIDEDGVYEAMTSDRKNTAFFLDLGTGDIVALDMPRDQELFDGMKKEFFAYAEIPRVVVTGAPVTPEALRVAFQYFVDSLPVTVERDFAEVCPEECDCTFCEFEKGGDK